MLNSVEEYKRLLELFEKHSSEVVCICCFRDLESYKVSYIAQLQKQGIGFSDDRDSYRYVKSDSWLFDYKRKENILRQVFKKVIFFSYNQNNMVQTFMEQIGYSAADGDSVRLNVTKYT